MAVIAIDMDGTIANFAELSFKKVGELYGIKMSVEKDAYKPKTAQLVWEKMTEEQRSRYNHPNEIYGEVCAKGFFLEIEPLKGAIEAVNEIAAAGHDIYFLTKVLNWDRSANEKAEWLDAHFPDLKYSIIMVDNVKAKHIVDADIIIDDDIRVLEGTCAIPICIAQPWNKGQRDRFPIIVKDMAEAVDEVKNIATQLEYWKSE